MTLSQATNGNTEYEIYDIGNNAISAGQLLGKIGADWQFAGLGGFTAGRELPSSGLMSARTGCGHERYSNPRRYGHAEALHDAANLAK